MIAIYVGALLILVLALLLTYSWASYEGHSKAKRSEALFREQQIKVLDEERRHQREVLRLSAKAQVKLLQRAINQSSGNPALARLLGEALAQQVEVLQWTGSGVTGEILEVALTPLPPMLRRLKFMAVDAAQLDCTGFESWSNLFAVSPRGKLAQALERLFSQLASAPGKIEMRAAIEGRSAVLTLRSSAVRPDLYADFTTAMARNWIIAARGEITERDGAYRIALPFECAGEDGGGHQAAVPARGAAK